MFLVSFSEKKKNSSKEAVLVGFVITSLQYNFVFTRKLASWALVRKQQRWHYKNTSEKKGISLGKIFPFKTGNKTGASWNRHLDSSAWQFSLHCTRLSEVNKDRLMNKSWGPGHGQKSVKGPYEEETDEETSRKAGRANKVLSGDAFCARKSILLPLTPERSLTCCKKHEAERRAAWMKGAQPPAGWEQQTWNGSSKHVCR